ncbi:MAG TPA: hypothetical protein VF177_06085 [Anaerolineae bacterium]
MEHSPHRPSGMRGFTIVWLGQVVSLLGTGMTNFAVWLCPDDTSHPVA